MLCTCGATSAPAHKTVGGVLEVGWEDWNESINKLDTRTKTAAGEDVGRCPKTGAGCIQQPRVPGGGKSGIYRIMQTTNQRGQMERA